MWLQRQGEELGKAINDLQHCIESNYMNMKNEILLLSWRFTKNRSENTEYRTRGSIFIARCRWHRQTRRNRKLLDESPASTDKDI